MYSLGSKTGERSYSTIPSNVNHWKARQASTRCSKCNRDSAVGRLPPCIDGCFRPLSAKVLRELFSIRTGATTDMNPYSGRLSRFAEVAVPCEIDYLGRSGSLIFYFILDLSFKIIAGASYG